jgi:peroxiredoxin
MYIVRITALAAAIAFSSCGGTMDDLRPSGADNTQTSDADTTGGTAGQKAPDFTVSDTLGRSVNLYTELDSGVTAVVLYFTMWCPVCAAHSDNMRNNIVPLYPNVKFFLVDYVSGTVSAAREAQVSNGYANSAFGVLVDSSGSLISSFGATMGTTVVISKTGVVTMKEDYKDGTPLKNALAKLLVDTRGDLSGFGPLTRGQ